MLLTETENSSTVLYSTTFIMYTSWEVVILTNNKARKSLRQNQSQGQFPTSLYQWLRQWLGFGFGFTFNTSSGSGSGFNFLGKNSKRLEPIIQWHVNSWSLVTDLAPRHRASDLMILTHESLNQQCSAWWRHMVRNKAIRNNRTAMYSQCFLPWGAFRRCLSSLSETYGIWSSLTNVHAVLIGNLL